MARDFTVRARFTADTRDARRGIDQLRQSFDEAGDEIERLEDATEDLGRTTEQNQSRFRQFGDFLRNRFVITLGDVVSGVRALGRLFTEGARDATNYQEAVQNLNSALERAGASGATEAYEAQADALAKLTGETDEAILRTQAFLAQLGVAPDQIQQATQAAVDLSAALGISLESAARNVGRTVGGFAGELGELVPELKSFSTEALQAGEGIEFLADRFAGTAQATRTAQDAFRNLENAISDLRRSFIEGATGADDLEEGLDKVSDALQRAETTAEAAGGALNLALRGTVGLFNDLLLSAGAVANAVDDVFSEDVIFNAEALEATADRLGITVGELQQRLAANAEQTRRVNAETRELADAQDDAAEAASDAARANAELTDSLASQADAYAQAIDSARAFGQTTSVALEAQILRIRVALEQQRDILGENSREFQNLRRVAEREIEGLELRIRSLRDGYGDLAEAQTEAIESSDALTDSFGNAAEGAAELGGAVDRTSDQLRNLRAEAARTDAAVRGSLIGGEFQRERTTSFGLSGGTFTRITPNATVDANGRVVVR